MRRQQLAAFGVSLIVVTVAVEAALRVGVPPWRFLDPHRDVYWQVRLAAQQPGAHRSWEHDPALGWRMRRGVDGEHDSRGFRGAREPSAERRGPRILAVGDSFTYGLGVAANETFVARLGVAHDAETINAGVNGYGVDQSLLMWESEGRPLQPDIVLLGLFVGDVYRNGLRVRDAGPKPFFHKSEGGYRLVGVPVPTVGEYLSQALPPRGVRVIQAASWVTTQVEIRLRAREKELEPLSHLNHYLLGRFAQSVQTEGAEPLVVLIPDARRHGGAEARWLLQELRASCQQLELSCVDLAEEFGTEIDRYYRNGHWNAAGHARAADRITTFLDKDPFRSILGAARERGHLADTSGEGVD